MNDDNLNKTSGVPPCVCYLSKGGGETTVRVRGGGMRLLTSSRQARPARVGVEHSGAGPTLVGCPPGALA